MSLRNKERLILLTGIVGALVLLTGRSASNMVLSGLGLALLLGAMVLYLRLLRCPHCGEQLTGSKETFCKCCGKPVKWDAK